MGVRTPHIQTAVLSNGSAQRISVVREPEFFYILQHLDRFVLIVRTSDANLTVVISAPHIQTAVRRQRRIGYIFIVGASVVNHCVHLLYICRI